MPHVSYRAIYRLVERAPAKLARLLEEGILKANNPRYLLSLLIPSSAEEKVGEYWRSDRKVHFGTQVRWQIRSVCSYMTEVPEISVFSAVGALNEFFATLGLPYRVWFSCEKGNHNCRSGSRAYQERTPFLVGLVDIRQPKILAQSPQKSAQLQPRAG